MSFLCVLPLPSIDAKKGVLFARVLKKSFSRSHESTVLRVWLTKAHKSGVTPVRLTDSVEQAGSFSAMPLSLAEIFVEHAEVIEFLIHEWERRLVRRDTNRLVRPFEWGMECLKDFEQSGAADGALVNGDREKALSLIVDFNRRAIAGSDRFFGLTRADAFSFDGHWLTFASPLPTAFEENNTCFGRFFPARERTGRRNAGSEEVARAERRAVVVLPQWNADSEGHVALCRLLNRVGIAALRLSLPYHERRMPQGLERADYLISANLGRTLQACRQAVMEVRAAITWLFERGYDRVGILGTSIGSCIAFLTFVHDERLRVGVYNHVSSYFGDVVWEGISTAHVRRGLETSISREEVRQTWLAISPSSYIERLARNPRKGLFLSARYDLTFPPELTRLLFDECESHGINYDRRLVPWGHYTMGVSPFKYYAAYSMVNYFRKHL